MQIDSEAEIETSKPPKKKRRLHTKRDTKLHMLSNLLNFHFSNIYEKKSFVY